MLWTMFVVALVSAMLSRKFVAELCILTFPILLFLTLRYLGTHVDRD
jgi:hypothetical protein